MAGLHQLDAMRQPVALVLHLGQLLLLDAELGLDVFKLRRPRSPQMA